MFDETEVLLQSKCTNLNHRWNQEHMMEKSKREGAWNSHVLNAVKKILLLHSHASRYTIFRHHVKLFMALIKKTKGVFIPPVVTPRRSPRLAAWNLLEQETTKQVKPVRETL